MELPDLQETEPKHGAGWWLQHGHHQDPVRALHDTQEEAGDEAGLADLYCMDLLEAEQRSVALDETDAPEPPLYQEATTGSRRLPAWWDLRPMNGSDRGEHVVERAAGDLADPLRPSRAQSAATDREGR